MCNCTDNLYLAVSSPSASIQINVSFINIGICFRDGGLGEVETTPETNAGVKRGVSSFPNVEFSAGDSCDFTFTLKSKVI